MKVELHLRALLLPLAILSSAAMAQTYGANQISKGGVAQLGSGERELQDAMRRIAVDPNNADALVDAGNASLTLGDAKSALNFFTRANAARPNDGRILAGLGSASVRTENPFEALRLFDEAVKLGISERSIAADRGLAFDLLGNFARAQQDYQIARTVAPSDDLIVRQAISMSLSGRTSEADQMLIPLLDRNVMAAWRARAFILAARGDVKESSKVAAGFLDANSLQKMDRYLRLMPELTDAQKAAAIHLGHFPQSYEIGRDSEAVKRIAATIPAAGSDRLIPSGAPFASKAPVKKESASAKRKREREEQKLAEAQAKLKTRKKEEPPVKVAAATKPAGVPKAAVLTPSAQARIDQAQASNVTIVSGQLPPPENARPLVSVAAPAEQKLPDATPVETRISAAAPTTIAPATTMPATVTPQPVAEPPLTAATGGAVFTASSKMPDYVGPPAGQSEPAAQPTQIAAVDVAPSKISTPETPVDTSIASVGPGFQSVPANQPAAPAPDALAAFDLGAVVASISIPDSEMHRAVAPVDLSKIKPAAPKVAAVDTAAKVDPKSEKAKTAAKTPSNPARNWVQVATGNASAYPYEFKQLAKKSPELFSGREGWSSEWGNNDRLLVGPFADAKDAKKWEADFRKAGGSGFVWQSADGTVVSKVAGATAPKLSTPTSAKTPAKAAAKTSGKPDIKAGTGKASTAKTGTAKAPAKQTSKSKAK